MQGIPTLVEVRAWVQAPASAIPDADLDQIREAELAIQGRLCRLPVDNPPDAEATYPAPLARALLRRCQREVAARNLPLGMLTDGEYGPAVLAWDQEIQRLEASYRIPVVA